THRLGKGHLSAFTQELSKLGWTDGRNLRMVIRWTAGDLDRTRMMAKELVDLQLDLILANTTPVTAALQQETRTIPLVFVVVADPITTGFVASLSHPGGNITGFIYAEGAMTGKWLELLTQIAPALKRAAIIFNPDTAPRGGSYFLPSFEAASQSLKINSVIAPVHNDTEIERVMISLSGEQGSGVVVMPDNFTFLHRASIISLAARNRVPTVYYDMIFAREGGLLGYGSDQVDIFRRSASYVDRILRGAKPADLPVQLPTKFEMAVNVGAAKALGLTVPDKLLVAVDEVIE